MSRRASKGSSARGSIVSGIGAASVRVGANHGTFDEMFEPADLRGLCFYVACMGAGFGCDTTSAAPAPSVAAPPSPAKEPVRPADPMEQRFMVAHVPVAWWNDAGNNPLEPFSPQVVTSSQETAIRRVAAELPAFPRSAYSGCHARAHYIYMQSLKASDAPMFKVWLFSGEALSPALSGAIKHGKASWNYHVAAAYLTAAGVMVIDPLLSKEPLSQNDWLGRLDMEGLVTLSYLPGRLYLFNRTEVEALDPVKYPDGLRKGIMSRNVVNGNFFEYVGESADEHRAAGDLATDRVSFMLESETTECPWKGLASKPLDLKSELLKDDEAPPQCREFRSAFKEELALWSSRGL